MADKNNAESKEQQGADKASGATNAGNKNVVAAHDQAEADIENDPDMAMDEAPGDDLDEGELARLDNDNDNTDLV